MNLLWQNNFLSTWQKWALISNCLHSFTKYLQNKQNQFCWINQKKSFIDQFQMTKLFCHLKNPFLQCNSYINQKFFYLYIMCMLSQIIHIILSIFSWPRPWERNFLYLFVTAATIPQDNLSYYVSVGCFGNYHWYKYIGQSEDMYSC